MPIIKKKHKNNFVSLDNTIAQDHSYSFAARGMLIYLLSRPNNWKINRKELGKGWSGVTTVDSALDELRVRGHLFLVTARTERIEGKIWFVSEEVISKEEVLTEFNEKCTIDSVPKKRKEKITLKLENLKQEDLKQEDLKQEDPNIINKEYTNKENTKKEVIMSTTTHSSKKTPISKLDYEELDYEELDYEESDYEKLFTMFWENYPTERRKDKSKLLQKFKNEYFTEDEFVDLMLGLDKWKSSKTWLTAKLQKDWRYIPFITTWFNQRRWKQEPPEVVAPISDDNPERTHQLIQMYSKEILFTDSYLPNYDEMKKFIDARREMDKFFVGVRERILPEDRIKYLIACLKKEFQNGHIKVGNLRSDYTWKTLMPQYMVKSVGI